MFIDCSPRVLHQFYLNPGFFPSRFFPIPAEMRLDLRPLGFAASGDVGSQQLAAERGVLALALLCASAAAQELGRGASRGGPMRSGMEEFGVGIS